ncbi:MAG: prolipoprotein diacylglyceryl transferase [Gammaproteobacteria bacterium]|jgi:phosphatidylglycerol---prolipoprotein diacylglyceryl transferase|nr:prolipoprotein diacylglyceryl transferase [Gammaproteobacteria bacterium]MBT3860421.1 prolipoprotein diacylglyceryl transferase [Gammaproteobacteria bacterium]MBT3988698.1 prolipoprotein diacylglyceryl transferase [Gammaproteobacteria bacterium]MBT4255295.1 prolipoprotein diacylglyceryl transferase [Gammaproteobacteria bacterium]MBT4581420.1 prolipoprotein diacylglyceryl transferase [Gammaproteobacteria bacterium]
MLTFPQFDPIALSIGPLSIHWYGIMYIIAFGGAWALASHRAKTDPGQWSGEQISDLVFYGALGAVLGGRFGSVIFYNFDRFLSDPIWLLRVWEGGMSFHGGLLGVLAAFYFYSKRINKEFFQVMDFVAPLVPFGLGAGRIGNFIGGELWGRPTDVAWGMVFPHVDQLARHPSQLYEFALEGVVLFVFLWIYSSKPRPRGAITGVFAIGYGCFRFFIEFFRQPDLDIGYVAFQWLTMGQLLSTPMILIGMFLVFRAYRGSAVSQ